MNRISAADDVPVVDGMAEVRRSLSWRVAAVRIGVSGVLLALLFYLLPLDQIRGAIARIPAVVWPVAVALYMALHLIGVFKWRMLVNAAGADLPLLHATRSYYAGLFGNTFLPSVVGGDIIRAAVAARRVRSMAGLILGSLVDRVQDVIGLAAVAAIGALLLPTALDERSRSVFGVLAITAVVAVVVLALVLRLTPVRRLPLRFRRRLVRVRIAFRSLSSRPRAQAGAFLLGMVLQTLQIVLNAWLAGMAGLDAPFQVWLLVWPLAKIAATLPLTQGGLGVREAALAALFAPFGVAAALAVAASLVFQVVVISGGLIGGLVSMSLGRHSPDSDAARPASASLTTLNVG
ncbi:MAG TPA: lysylphosphatidylglycerol synthase transmembrane domain-containing protein [Longimicrobiales bacterium]|nr:lysylphosphatidylglycerol synthase transmembrane domain-containing protein [Longimicrobiales bacterium]